MSIRFSDASGGLPSGAILFAPDSSFTGGVSGVMATTLADAVLSAVGAVSQFYVEDFDVSINIYPNYVDTWWQGIDLTMSPTLEDAVLFAQGNISGTPAITGDMAVTLEDAVMSASGSVGLPVSGTMNVTLDNAVMVANGVVVPPITGTMNVTLDDAVLVAGDEFLGVKTTKVYVRFEQVTKVYVR